MSGPMQEINPRRPRVVPLLAYVRAGFHRVRGHYVYHNGHYHIPGSWRFWHRIWHCIDCQKEWL